MFQPNPDPDSTRTIRHDGLTPDRQAQFLAALAATGNVSDAAAAAGVSRTALYRFRNSAEGAAFQARWGEALQEAVSELADIAFGRARNGVSEPVWYKGEKIGERIRYNDRLLMFMLRAHDPATYAPPPRPSPSIRPAALTRRIASPEAGPDIAPVLASTLSTSPGRSEAALEADMDDETFRAELRKLRGAPEIPRGLSKRNARRLAARGRLPAALPT